jgi:hypothetical protein
MKKAFFIKTFLVATGNRSIATQIEDILSTLTDEQIIATQTNAVQLRKRRLNRNYHQRSP